MATAVHPVPRDHESGPEPRAPGARPVPLLKVAGRVPRWLSDWRTWITCLLVAVIVAVGVWQLHAEERQRLADLRLTVQDAAEDYAVEIKRQVVASASATWALGAVVQAFGTNMSFPADAFATVASTLSAGYKGVTMLQLAPAGVVEHVWPERELTLKALGISLLVVPPRRAELLDEIAAYPKRRASITGPRTLKLLGETGVIIRHPIFTTFADKYLELPPYYYPPDDATYTLNCSTPTLRAEHCHLPGPDAPDGSPTFLWGFATVISSVPDLVRPTGLERLERKTVGGLSALGWQMRDLHPHPELSYADGIFASSPSAPLNVTLADAVVANVTIGDLGVHWQILVAPDKGWPRVSEPFAVQLLLVVLFTLVGGLGMGGAVIGAVRATHARSEAELNAQLETHALQAAALARSRLIRTVMHDLRSPLLSISTLTRALLLRHAPHDAAPVAVPWVQLDAVRECAQLCEGIVSDMLDFERIEAGRLSLHFRPFLVADVLRGCAATFGSIAALKGVRLLLLEPEPSVACAQLLGDLRRIQQCVNNGLSNAIKFTPAGRHIRVALALRDAEPPPEPPHADARTRLSSSHRQPRPLLRGRTHTITSTRSRWSAARGPLDAYKARSLSGRTSSARSTPRDAIRDSHGTRARDMHAPAGADGPARRSGSATAPGDGGDDDDGVDAPVVIGWVELLVDVTDEGTGLGAAELELLNEGEPFTQVGLGQMQGNAGTGLGLSIVRQVTKLHHASSVSLASGGPDCGCTFSLRIRCERLSHAQPPPNGGAADGGALRAASPRGAGSDSARAHDSEAPSRAAPAAAPADARGAGAGPACVPFPADYRVLHVEDDAFVRLALPLTTFVALGIEYAQAEHGGEATARILERGERFDAVVIDNQMPVMGGAATASALRAGGYRGLIVGVTGDPSGCADRDSFETSGLDRCLSKDTEGMEQLVNALRDHARQIAAGAIARAAALTAMAAPAESVVQPADASANVLARL